MGPVEPEAVPTRVLDLCRVDDETRAAKRRVEDHQQHVQKARILIRAAERCVPELVDDPGEGLNVEGPAVGAEALMTEEWAADKPDDDNEPVQQRVFFPNTVPLP